MIQRDHLGDSVALRQDQNGRVGQANFTNIAEQGAHRSVHLMIPLAIFRVTINHEPD